MKVLTATRARQSSFHELFRREIQALAKLDHRNIAAVLDAGEVATSSILGGEGLLPAGSPWLAMEFVPGVPLHEPPLLSWAPLRRAFLGLLDALAHAHALGVIHRDLKPSNVLVDWAEDAPRVTVVDFGIALAQGDEQSDVAQDTLGTPRYMAPEQITGRWRDQGPWTDLYSLGCMVWASLCGSPPFGGQSVHEVLAAHVGAPLPPLEPRFPVPDGVERWLRKLLRKDPHQRIQRAADAAYELLGLRPLEDVTGPSNVGATFDPSQSSRTAVVDLLADTIVSSDIELPTGEFQTDNTVVSGGIDAEPRALGMRPPIPHQPAAESVTAVSKQLLGAGLGLYGLRGLPLVDRQAARAQLWEAMREVGRTRRPQAVILEGPAGYGKSRLARWLIERSHEVGAAIGLEVRHSRMPSAQDGLGAMLSRTFRCAGLDYASIVGRLEAACDRMGYESVERAYDPMGLANTIAVPDGDTTMSGGFMGTHERYMALRRLLARMSRERVIVLWIDDLQWGADAAAFAQFLLQDAGEDCAAILVVMTLLTGSGDALAPAARALTELADVRRLAVGPLTQPDQRELARRLLRLDERVVDVVVRRTEGSPLFAEQLVGHWVKHDVLTLAEDGFAPVGGRALGVPDDVHAVWHQRIEAALAPLAAADRRSGLVAVEVAAVLGREVETAEWMLACSAVGIPDPVAIQAALLREHLAVMTEDGWAFAHGMLRESVLQQSLRVGRGTALHKACADALAGHRAPTRQQSRRRAEHLVLAGESLEGASLLLLLARQSYLASEYAEAYEALERMGAALRQAGVADDAPLWAERAWLLARQLHALGSFDELDKLLATALPAARHHQHGAALGRLLITKARLLREQGKLIRSMRGNTEAIALLEAAGDLPGVAEACGGLAADHLKAGDLQGARRNMEQARRGFDAAGIEVEGARARAHIAYTYIAEGQHEKALPWLRDALVIARRNNHCAQIAHCENYLGEIERMRCNWDAAQGHYETAAEHWALSGHRDELVAWLNVALTMVQADRYEAADRHLRRVERDPRMRPQHMMQTVVSMARLVCLSYSGDWASWDAVLGKVEGHLANTHVVELDLATCASKALEMTVARGDLERAARVAKLARVQWSGLAREGELERFEWLLGREPPTQSLPVVEPGRGLGVGDARALTPGQGFSAQMGRSREDAD